MSRINISKETRAQIEKFASLQGHNNLTAALATIVKLGLPFLLSNDQRPIPNVQPTNLAIPFSEMTDKSLHDGIDISRLANLLEEF